MIVSLVEVCGLLQVVFPFWYGKGEGQLQKIQKNSPLTLLLAVSNI